MLSFFNTNTFSIGTSKSAEEQTELKEKIAKACVYIHLSLVKASTKFLAEHKRYYYLTPSCFIDLLKTFIKIFDAKRVEYLVSLYFPFSFLLFEH